MPQQSQKQDTICPPNFLPCEKAIKFIQDLLWKQPRLHFLPHCLIALVAYTCNITLFGSNMGEFWMQSRFHTVSSYESWFHSFFFPYHFTKKRLFLFVALLRNSHCQADSAPDLALPSLGTRGSVVWWQDVAASWKRWRKLMSCAPSSAGCLAALLLPRGVPTWPPQGNREHPPDVPAELKR